jgi:hypothetical protein
MFSDAQAVPHIPPLPACGRAITFDANGITPSLKEEVIA